MDAAELKKLAAANDLPAIRTLAVRCLGSRRKYGPGCKHTPIMVHPEHSFDRQAAPRPEMRITDAEYLERFKSALSGYAEALGSLTTKPDVAAIAPLLDHFKFRPGQFVETYTRRFKHAR